MAMRVWVVGTSGSGKTTLARQAAQALGVPHTELDAVHWLPKWQARPLDDFRALVAERVAAPRWVIDGNYSKVADLVRARATHWVWLNYPRWLVMWRVITRTTRRVLTRQALFGGNRESWGAIFGRDSVIAWAWNTYNRRLREYGAFAHSADAPHVTRVVLTSPQAAERWLATLKPLKP